jgi:DNA-binding response OmpR family regulator
VDARRALGHRWRTRWQRPYLGRVRLPLLFGSYHLAARLAVPAMRVLVVDDNPDVLAVIEELLASYGYEVTGSASADRARTRMAAKDYDFVLIDAPMDLLSDVTLAVDVRESGTPVLMMPAGGDQHLELEIAGLPYIQKPFTSAELVAAIDALTRDLREDPIARPPHDAD